MRLMQMEYYPVKNADCVWLEEDSNEELNDEEWGLIIDARKSFPLHCTVEYDYTPVTGRNIIGTGKVIGYVLRNGISLFHPAYVYLLVMCRTGLISLNLLDVRNIDSADNAKEGLVNVLS